ncbi:hypothetical protein ACTFIU_007511 [Dictyostelium citrinum]
MKKRGIILIFFLFIFFKLNQTLIESEYQCSFNLFNKILNVSLEYNIDSNNRYDFCSLNNRDIQTVSCDQENNVVLSIYLFGRNSSTIFSSSDFNCFSSINIIQLYYNYKFEKNFLYGFSKIIPHFLSYSTDESLIDSDFNVFDNNNNNDNINNKTILIDRLVIKNLIINNNYNFYFSRLINVNFFEVECKPSNYQINYINDLVLIKSFITLNIYSNNIPSMNNINIKNLVLNLLPSFNLESFFNFSTFLNVKDLYLNPTYPSDIFPFPLPLCDLVFNNSLQYLEINYQIDKPFDFIDLSGLNNLDIFIMPNVGSLFNIDGEFPFINMNQYYTRFEFSNGRINNYNFINSSTLKMENNGMTGTISTTFPGDTYLYLKGNKLVGEIDESWCGSTFDISENYIGGELPSCFKCHYLQSNVGPTLSGNRFINFNPNNLEPCLDLELNLIFDNSTRTLSLYGKNLGPFQSSVRIYNIKNIGILPIEPCKNFLIRKNFWVPGVLPKVINITFPFLPQGPRTFEISAYNEFLPQIDSMVRYSDYFIINGKYFAYNQSVINVLISNHPCSIITSNFNRIQCYLSNSIQIINNNNNNELITCIIQVMNVSSTFKFTVNQACNGDNCPIADCSKYGEYNYESGVCDCYSNESRGYSCELKSLDCSSKDCSGNGYCNQIIGKCECNKNRIYDDCSGIICNDGKGCYNGGNCNFQSGICNCSSKWIETSACTIPKQSVDSQQLQQNKNDQILILIGWFGDINKFLTISIDGKVCDIISNDNESIQCIPPNYDCELIKTSSFKLSVSQNNYIWDGIYNPIFINGCNNDEDSSRSSSNSSISISSSSISKNDKENSSSPPLSSSSKNSIIIIIISIVISLFLLSLLGMVFLKKLIIKNNYFNLNNIEIKIKSSEYDYDQPDKLSKNKIKLIQLKS